MDLNQYVRVTSISLFHVFATFMLFSILAPYFSSLGFSDAWISAVFGIFPIATFVTASIVGELSDKIGRNWTIKVALLINAFAFLLYFTGQAWAIIIGRALDAISYTAVGILVLSKIEDHLEDKNRGRFTGILMSLQHVAKFGAPIVGGFLADTYIGAPFFVSIGILLSLVLMLRNDKLHKKRDHVHLHPLRNIYLFFKNKELRPLAILGIVTNAVQPAFLVFLPLLIVKQFGLTYVDVGLAISVHGAGHMLQFFFGDLSDKFGRRKFIIIGCFTFSFLMMLIPVFATSYAKLLIILGAAGVGGSIWNVTAWTYMSDVGGKLSKEGTIIGTYTSIAKIGPAISYFAAGAISLIWGYYGVFLILGAFAFAGTIVAALMFIYNYFKN